MRDTLYESAIPLIALSFSIYYFITVFDAPWEAKIYSYALIGAIFICSAVIAIKTINKKKGSEHSKVVLEKETNVASKNLAIIAGVSIAFVISIYAAGYFISALLFLIIAPFLMGYRKKSIFFIAFIVVGLIFALFVEVLQLKLPIGIIFS